MGGELSPPCAGYDRRGGGRYLAFSQSPEQWEGNGHAPGTLAIVAFPSMEAARRFFNSPEYAPFAKSRQAGARATIMLAEGVPEEFSDSR